MGKSAATRSASIKVWVKPELREAIERAAQREGRSISNWIERALERTIEEADKGKRTK
jgi:predicted HicB family RNase H-like nuclease